VRIERHGASEDAVRRALEDFASRIGREIGLRQRAGREGTGWGIIATEFLDYVGARSLEDPDLSTEDVALALGSAAEAALAAVVLDAYRRRATRVFIPYTGSRVTYEGPDADDTADSRLHLDDWLRALYLSVVCGRAADTAQTFLRTARAVRSGRGPERGARPAMAQVHGMLGYLYGRFPDSAEPAARADVRDRLDMLVGDPDRTEELGGPARRRLAQVAALRALAAGDREAFERELAGLLSVHRDTAGGRPCELLPLDAIALAALATRREGWRLRIDSGYLPSTLVNGLPAAARPSPGGRPRPR
jgi:hypothetical protein